MKNKKKIAILTGGGDCPGLNAVIRAVVKKSMLDYGTDVIGIEDGFEGLVENRYRNLSYADVSSILTLGGTILGTSNKANPYKYPVKKRNKYEFKDLSRKAVHNLKKLSVDCLVCIGGDGTLGIAYKLFQQGVPVVGVPKTIDNDIYGTDITFGFNSAVGIATEAVDRIHSTAESHHRAMIIEVMGRKAGWIALYAGVAGGGDVILIPEIPYMINSVCARVKERNKKGKRFSIIVISEGAKPKGGNVVVQRMVADGSEPIRLGGVGFVLGAAIEKTTGIETRTVVIGHLQRGGSPTPFDRILGTRLGTYAAQMVNNKNFGHMAGIKGSDLVSVPLEIVSKGSRTVPVDHNLIASARSVGTSFGDF
ncbi:MAG: 6-phosphofructokinase [Candidatus Omnitrophota bacterium]